MRQRRTAVKANRPDPSDLSYDPRLLKRRRFAAGLTQVDAARLAGCSPSNICRLEHGEHNASVATLRALARTYECEIADFQPRDEAA